ncbi:hypothetical protein BH09BAC5_BH09BAC5_15250 [soil metagenome]
MHKLFSLLCFSFLFAGLSAQKADVKWGSTLESETNVQRILAEKSGKFFALSARKNDLYLERYNSKTFKQEFSNKIILPELAGKEQSIEDIFYLQSHFILFASLYDKKLNTFSIHAYSFNSDGVMSNDSPELFSIEAESRLQAGKVEFHISMDSTRILLAHYGYFKKEKTQRITLVVLDENLKKVTEAKEEYPTKAEGELHVISNYTINNKGDIFFLHTQITPAKGKMPAMSAFKIVSFTPDGKHKKDFPIDLEGKRIDRLLFSFDVNENLLVSGFYETKNDKGRYSNTGVSGTFFMSIDQESGSEKSKIFQEFDKALLDNYYTPKQLTKPQLLPNNFVPREIIQKEDGGVICVFEQYTYVYSQTKGGGSIEETYYGDLLVININAEGKIKWIKIIAKHQMFVQFRPMLGIGSGPVTVGFQIKLKNDQSIYYSYLLAIKGDQIIFVFNDAPANKEIRLGRDSETLTKIKGAIPMMVTLTEGGDVSKKALLEAAGFDVIIRPRIAFQSSETRILIYGSKGDTDKFGVMNIE